MHDVVARCIYGVDLNPMAADLAKVSLWLEAMTPGKPLSFLDHHIKVGNALLGTTPALLHAGIPEAAFAALAGDDKKTCVAWRKLNLAQRSGQTSIFDTGGIDVGNLQQRQAVEEVAARANDARSLADIAWATQRYSAEVSSDHATRARRTADAWCAAFLSPKGPNDVPITHEALAQLGAGTASVEVTAVVDALAAKHRLFHWHLEFPEIFQVPEEPASTPAGWTGGFSATLGNPPWERVKLQEQEFFASRDEAIANAKNAAARKKAIEALRQSHPELLDEFSTARREAEAESQFLRTGGRYPLCGVGDVNTYSVFAETFRSLLDPSGQLGIIVPTGIVTDSTTQAYARAVAPELVALYDFRNAGFFEGVASAQGVRFCVLAVAGTERSEPAHLAFRAKNIEEVTRPDRVVTVSAAEIQALNPNTGTFPIFLSRRDAAITLACYRRHPVLIRDGAADGNPWGLRFTRLFDMATDSGEFRTASDLEDLGASFDGWSWTNDDASWLPLYEAKMLHIYQHRFGSYHGYDLRDGTGVRAIPTPSDQELDDPDFGLTARYWVAEKTVNDAVPRGWDRDWLFGWRDIASGLDMRTFVPSALPRAAVGHVFPVAVTSDPSQLPLLQAVWSSLVGDYLARQKMSGTHMTYGVINQLACPAPADFVSVPAWSDQPLESFVRARVAELTYTSHRMKPYAADVVVGAPGDPFRWLPERREQLKTELDAAMLHLYGLDRSDAEHVLDSFPVVQRYDERNFGEFRTKRLVLAAYDAMTHAAQTGVPFVSPLNPPPGDGPRHPEQLS